MPFLFLLATAPILQPAQAGPVPVVLASPSPAQSGSVAPAEILTFLVELKGGRQTLWSGRMVVSDRAGATMNHTETNAITTPCETGAGPFRPTSGGSVSVYLMNLRRMQNVSGVNVRASWERPTENANCQTGPGTRTVTISDTVWLDPGETKTLQADGGFTIRLKRL